MQTFRLFLFTFLFSNLIYSQSVETLSMFMDIDAFKTDPNIIYISTLGMGIMKSTDAGNSWFSASSGIEYKDVFSVKVSPQDPNILLATVWNNCCGVGGFLGIYKSTDAGNSWYASNTGIKPSANLFRIVYDPGNPNIVYVAGYFGAFYKSTDGGDNWISLSYPGGDINGIIVQPDGTIWCGGWYSVRKSTDQGLTWQTIPGLPGGTWNLLSIVNPRNDANIVYLTLHYTNFQKVIYKTTDNGSSWTQIGQQINGGYLIGIGDNDNLLVIGSKNGLFLSPDGGNSWNPIDTNNIFLAHNGVISNNVFYLVSGGGVSAVRNITTRIGESFEIVPLKFSLSQNYPNPFNPYTVIEFTLSSPEKVSINIYDVNGQLIRNLFDEELLEGAYTTRWEGTDNFGRQVASGTYFYRIEAGNSFDVKKMILIK